MSEARSAILERIRCNKHLHKHQPASGSVDEWLQQHTVGPQPQWPEDMLQRFMTKLQQSGASFSRISATDDIVNEIVKFVEQHELDGPLVSAATPSLKNITWPGELSVEYRAAQAGDQIVLSEAFCAVAETGSVVLRSGIVTPTTLNFLPEYFICLVQTKNIVNWMEDVWTLLRSDSSMPRAVNFVTGPSRTADVEQQIQMGAHGPRHVHILVSAY